MPLSYFDPALRVYILTLAALLGAVLASFVGCALSRSLRGEDFFHGRSRCDACGHVLGPLDLVPVLSWVLLKGKCRFCGQKIPASCPVTEALTGAAFALLVWRFGLGWRTAGYLVLTVLLLALSLADWATGELPDRLLLAAAADFVVMTLLTVGPAGLLRGLLGGVAAAGPLLALVLIMDRLLGRESMGGGDIKLFFVCGLFLRWQTVLYLIILSCLLGIALALLGGRTAGDPDDPRAFPFGPAIALGAVASLLTADPVLAWYLGLL